MKRAVLSLAIGCALFAGASASHADVIYEWQATNNEVPRAFSMRLVFDDATVRNGTFTLRTRPFDPTYGDPGSGLIFMSYSFDTGATYKPREEGAGFRDIDMSLQFGHWGISSGSIRLLDQFYSFELSGGGNGFTITKAAGDGGLWGSGCSLFPGYGLPTHDQCYGASGRFLQIPEPAPLALLGLGVVGALTARRLAAKQKAR